MGSTSVAGLATGDDCPSTDTTVINPLGPKHTHTVIFLHGREDFGEDLAQYFFDSKSSGGMSMADLFPSVRWVFPTAKLRYSARRDFEFSNSSFAEALKGEEIISQWFDVWDIKTPEEKKHLMIPGLRESIEDIYQIVQEEAQIVPLNHIILGGISQGCATSILALLASDINLGGYIGLCSWLPFRKEIDLMAASKNDKNTTSGFIKELLQLKSIANSSSKNVEPTEGSTDDTTDTYLSDATTALQRLSVDSASTPVFFAHSRDDDTVPFEFGEGLGQTLQELGYNVELKEYEDGGHWIHPSHGVDDMATFLGNIIG
jgi:predicted esterase